MTVTSKAPWAKVAGPAKANAWRDSNPDATKADAAAKNLRRSRTMEEADALETGFMRYSSLLQKQARRSALETILYDIGRLTGYAKLIFARFHFFGKAQLLDDGGDTRPMREQLASGRFGPRFRLYLGRRVLETWMNGERVYAA